MWTEGHTRLIVEREDNSIPVQLRDRCGHRPIEEEEVHSVCPPGGLCSREDNKHIHPSGPLIGQFRWPGAKNAEFLWVDAN